MTVWEVIGLFMLGMTGQNPSYGLSFEERAKQTAVPMAQRDGLGARRWIEFH